MLQMPLPASHSGSIRSLYDNSFSSKYRKGARDQGRPVAFLVPRVGLRGLTVVSNTAALPVIEYNAVDDIEHEKRRWYHYLTCANIKSFLKSVITFTCSQIGLAVLVILYCIIGGFMFKALEAEHEGEMYKVQKTEVHKIRTKLVDRIYNATERMPLIHYEEWTDEINKEVDAFIDELQMKYLEKKWRMVKLNVAKNEVQGEMQWTFPGALLYSITVITTIGYGHITPKTDAGRIITIFYALIGAPLMFLFLANIGNFFGAIFRLAYKGFNKVLCRNRSRRKNDDRSSVSRNSSLRIAKQLHNQHKANQEAAIRMQQNATKPKSQSDQLSRTGSAPNPNTTSGYNEDTVSSTEEYGNQSDVELMSDQKSQVSGTTGTMNQQYSIVVQDTQRRKSPANEIVSVPVSLCIFVIASYIIGGAVIFMFWENWSFLASAYFCFITLSTIGFGDYVPGTMTSTNGEITGEQSEKLIVLSLWLVFGMSVISMCLGLMQEEVKNKVRRLGQKIGIIDMDE